MDGFTMKIWSPEPSAGGLKARNISESKIPSSVGLCWCVLSCHLWILNDFSSCYQGYCWWSLEKRTREGHSWFLKMFIRCHSLSLLLCSLWAPAATASQNMLRSSTLLKLFLRNEVFGKTPLNHSAGVSCFKSIAEVSVFAHVDLTYPLRAPLYKQVFPAVALFEYLTLRSVKPTKVIYLSYDALWCVTSHSLDLFSLQGHLFISSLKARNRVLRVKSHLLWEHLSGEEISHFSSLFFFESFEHLWNSKCSVDVSSADILLSPSPAVALHSFQTQLGTPCLEDLCWHMPCSAGTSHMQRGKAPRLQDQTLRNKLCCSKISFAYFLPSRGLQDIRQL